MIASHQSHAGQRFRHSPYDLRTSRHWYGAQGTTDEASVARSNTPRSAYAATPEASPVGVDAPIGTRHLALWGRVAFVPYPTEEFVAPAAPKVPAGDLVRVFIGQLPYFVTDMQLAWMCWTLGGNHVVVYPERIMKRQPSGERLPTGCVHAYTTDAAVCDMATRMHKRMLVDDTGIWHAQDETELRCLSAYVADMKMSKDRRVPGRPYDTVVIQLATSTFVPRNVAAKPHLALRAVNDCADVAELATGFHRPRGDDSPSDALSTTSTAPRRAPAAAAAGPSRRKLRV